MSEKFFDKRRWPPQFNPHLPALPDIGQPPSSPIPSPSNQLIAFTGGPGDDMSSVSGDTVKPNYHQIDARLGVAEKSNRALLEEVVRLQSENKMILHHNDEVTREEYRVRQRTESALQANSRTINQLETRLQRTDDMVREQKRTLSTLMHHSKSVEESVLGTHQEMLSNRDLQSSRMQNIRSELEETSHARSQLERLSVHLADENRQLKNKLEIQNQELSSATSELKHRFLKLDDDTRHIADSLRTNFENQSQTERSTVQLRSQVETRLSELRDILVEQRGKQEQEIKDRRLLEHQTQQSVTELQTSLTRFSHQQEESLRQYAADQMQKEHAADKENIRLAAKIAESAEQLSSKALQRELKVREELQTRYAQLEQMLLTELEDRQGFEKNLRESAEERWESMRKQMTDEAEGLRERQQTERRKNKETLHRLHESVVILEQQLEGQKKQQERIISAEIKSRKQNEKNTLKKLDTLQEKLNAATSALTQAMGGATANMAARIDTLEAELRQLRDAQAVPMETTVARQDDSEIMYKVTTQLTQTQQIYDAKIALVQSNIREVAESVDKVKTVLGMKIQSEEKVRMKRLDSVHVEVTALREKIKQMSKGQGDGCLFVKPEVSVGDVNVNKWSIYTAYRWLNWKSKWMYVKWRRDAGGDDEEKGDEMDADGKDDGKGDADGKDDGKGDADGKDDRKGAAEGKDDEKGDADGKDDGKGDDDGKDDGKGDADGKDDAKDDPGGKDEGKEDEGDTEGKG